MSLGRLSKTLVKSSLGEVPVYSGKVEGRPMILAQLPSKQGHMLRSGMVVRGAQMKPDGSWTSAQWCNPVSMEEFNQVLQSLEVLKADAAATSEPVTRQLTAIACTIPLVRS